MKITLESLIESKKFDWVNSDIIPNFELPERSYKEYKIYSFDKRISSEDAIAKMKSDGFLPANCRELLEWNGDEKNTYTIALGSVGEVDGGRNVLVLDRGDSERSLYLSGWGGDWSAFFRFLAVRNLEIVSSEPLKSSSLNLGHLVSCPNCKCELEIILKK